MRLFVGIPVAHPALAEASVPLDCRVVPPGSWHLTLRFLGEGEPDDAKAALEGCPLGPPLVGRLTGVSGFPHPRRARIVYAAIAAEGLAGLAARVRAALPMGEPERHPFVPHVTLARCHHPAPVPRISMAGEVNLDEVVLYASHPGAEYRRLLAIPLE